MPITQRLRNMRTPLEKRKKQYELLVHEMERRCRGKEPRLKGKRLEKCMVSERQFNRLAEDFVQRYQKNEYLYHEIRDCVRDLLDLDLEERLDLLKRTIRNRFRSKEERIEEFKRQINGFIRNNDDVMTARDPIYDEFLNDLKKEFWLDESDIDREDFFCRLEKKAEYNLRMMEESERYWEEFYDPDCQGYFAEQQFYYEAGERDTLPDMNEYRAFKQMEEELFKEESLWNWEDSRIKPTENYNRDAVEEFNRDYQKKFGRTLDIYEIEDTPIQHPSSYNLRIRMKPRYGMIIDGRMIFSNEPYTVYFQVPFPLMKNVAEGLKGFKKNEWNTTHIQFETNHGRSVITLVDGFHDFKVTNNHADELRVWFRKGWEKTKTKDMDQPEELEKQIEGLER